MDPLDYIETIAQWGDAKLTRYLDGHYELQGGSMEDRKAATEWIEQFMPRVEEQLRERRRWKG